jgi:hypothetical protein
MAHFLEREAIGSTKGSWQKKGCEAVIAWGWENLDHYERWVGIANRQMARQMQGPVLEPDNPLTDLSEVRDLDPRDHIAASLSVRLTDE